ncbi:hypothetical protein MMC13_004961 [Lambiella insularis]|nr:hypothetical protein [Lambiella insularis]
MSKMATDSFVSLLTTSHEIRNLVLTNITASLASLLATVLGLSLTIRGRKNFLNPLRDLFQDVGEIQKMMENGTQLLIMSKDLPRLMIRISCSSMQKIEMLREDLLTIGVVFTVVDTFQISVDMGHASRFIKVAQPPGAWQSMSCVHSKKPHASEVHCKVWVESLNVPERNTRLLATYTSCGLPTNANSSPNLKKITDSMTDTIAMTSIAFHLYLSDCVSEDLISHISTTKPWTMVVHANESLYVINKASGIGNLSVSRAVGQSNSFSTMMVARLMSRGSHMSSIYLKCKYLVSD